MFEKAPNRIRYVPVGPNPKRLLGRKAPVLGRNSIGDGTEKRRPRVKKYALLCALLILSFIPAPAPVQAGDLVWRLTHGDQYALVLGTVKAAGRSEMTLAISRAISGKKLKGQVRVSLPFGRLPFRPQNGDHLLVSIGRESRSFHVKWGFFRVSSLRYNRLRIIGPGLSGMDQAALEHYVRSGGRENSFFGVFDFLFVSYPDGTFRVVYPKYGDTNVRHRVFICYDRHDYSLTMS